MTDNTLNLQKLENIDLQNIKNINLKMIDIDILYKYCIITVSFLSIIFNIRYKIYSFIIERYWPIR